MVTLKESILMKKSFLYIAGLIALIVVSCTDEVIVEQSGNGLRITGSLAQDSRTTFVEGDGVIETHWNVDDKITLYVDTIDENDPVLRTNTFVYKAVTSGKNTEFKSCGAFNIPNKEGWTIYACYPYDGTYAGYNMKHRIPSNTYLYGSDLPFPLLYGEGKISNNQLNFSFKHYFSYLRVKTSVQEIKELLADFLKQSSWAGQESEYDLGKTYLKIESSENISHSYGLEFNPKTHETTQTEAARKDLYLHLDNIDFSSDNSYTYMVPILSLPAGANVSTSIYFVKNGSSSPYFSINLLEKTVPEGGFKAGHVYNYNLNIADKVTDEEDKITNEKLAELLKTLYEKTGGPYWTNQTNWLSDKPVEEWEGIYLDPDGKFSSIYLYGNNLTGQFPEVLADIMDCSTQMIVLQYNYLSGYIPDKVKNHKYWKYWGWNIISQRPCGDPVVQDYNLYIPDIQLEYLFENESTTKKLYEILKENKLTQVIKGYDDSHKPNIEFINTEFMANRVNLHLDYESQGLSTIIYVGKATDEELQLLKDEISLRYGNINGIHWVTDESPIPGHSKSDSYFFDSNGLLKYYANYNYNSLDTQTQGLNTMSHNNCVKVLSSILGEPSEHPEYKPTFYTSTDYTRDGEVLTLQTATIGQGINLIFMGNAFVDRDMEPGGYYEQEMKQAMENFFLIEPYKSFRNRFNVYAVKVVSPNEEWGEGAEQALNYLNSYDYAIKVPNPYNQPLMTTIIANMKHVKHATSLGRSHCYMFENGNFVSFILTRDPMTPLHETGGHGFANLLDEYIENGYEGLTLSEEGKVYLDDAWKQWGYGANVDWRNDASTVKWSHFLNDDRYANEGLGLYEGAYLYGYGVYRPTENSIMRNEYVDGVQYNAPSREQIYKRIMQRSEGDSWTYDYEEFVKYDAINRNAASRSASRTMTEAEKREYIKNHQPPTIIQGTWRDAVKNGKSKIVVPLR